MAATPILPIIPLARFIATTSQLNKSHGVYLTSAQVVEAANIGFGIRDKSGLLYGPLSAPAFTGWESRLAVVVGKYGGDVSLFSIATDLSGFRVPLDTPLFTTSGFFSYAGDNVPSSDYGEGISILIATPTLYGNATPAVQVYLRLYGTQTALNAPASAQQGAGAAAAAAAAASSGSGSGGASPGPSGKNFPGPQPHGGGPM